MCRHREFTCLFNQTKQIMKRNLFYSGVAAMLIAFAALNVHAQADPASESMEAVRTQIEKYNTKMAEAMVKGDYTSSLSMYAEDAYSLPSYSPMVHGKESIRKSSEEMAASPMKIKSFKTDIEEIIHGGDLVVEIGTYDISMETEGSPDPMNDHGKYVTVWEKQDDGSLKIKVETWNSDTNPFGDEGM